MNNEFVEDVNIKIETIKHSTDSTYYEAVTQFLEDTQADPVELSKQLNDKIKKHLYDEGLSSGLIKGEKNRVRLEF